MPRAAVSSRVVSSLVIVLACWSVGVAALITVNTTADSGSGNCTLREAITAANTDSIVDACTAGSGADVIDLTGVVGTITLGGSLFIPTDVTINGPGARSLRISGTTGQTIRNDSGATVVINDVTIADTAGVGSFSSCITPCQGSLTLNRVRVTNCTGSPDPMDPVFGDAFGPAIATNCGMADLTILNSTFDDNHVTGGAGADGGAIWWAGAKLKIVNSTFSGNSAAHDGGAMIVLGGSPALDNVTFSSNSAAGSGGALVVANTAVVLRNTVVASSTQGGNCTILSGGTITSSYTLSDDTTCGPGTGDQINVGAGLVSLSSNGGPTNTHHPVPGSLLIDAGDPAGCTDQGGAPLLLDQRGVPRPQGPRCDIGAVEVMATTTTTVAPGSTTTTTLGVGACMTIPDCLASLGSTLPQAPSATTRKAKRTALKLHRLFTKLGKTLARAGASSGKKRTRLYGKARKTLDALLGAAQTAAGKSTLGVPLEPLQTAEGALLAKIPS